MLLLLLLMMVVDSWKERKGARERGKPMNKQAKKKRYLGIEREKKKREWTFVLCSISHVITCQARTKNPLRHHLYCIYTNIHSYITIYHLLGFIFFVYILFYFVYISGIIKAIGKIGNNDDDFDQNRINNSNSNYSYNNDQQQFIAIYIYIY